MRGKPFVSIADNLKGQAQRRPVAFAYLVYVGLDEHRQKMVLPPLRPTSAADVQLAHQADLRREYRQREAHMVPIIAIEPADTPDVVTLSHTVTAKDTNSQGNLFGGIILDLMGRVGKQAAERQILDGVVVGARIDRMQFLAPGFVGETLHLKAIVTQTWKTSMEVLIEAHAENPTRPGELRKMAESYWVFVRLNPSTRRPSEVPVWSPRTEHQHQRVQNADRRRELREEEKRRSAETTSTMLPWRDRLTWAAHERMTRLRRCWAIWTTGADTP